MALVQPAAPAAATGTAASGAGSARPAAASGLSFRALLSDLNPLQYIPVVGAVYRAVTGDEGNGTLRFVASLGTSFALGGPLGLGVTVAEKVAGIDPERIARTVLHRLLHPPARPGAVGGAAVPTAAATATATAAEARTDPAVRPWSAAELAAYAAQAPPGVGSGAGGGTEDADTLNAMELRRMSVLYA